MSALPPEAWLAALAGLPEMSPAALTAVLNGHSPEQAWNAARHGRLHGQAAELWASCASATDVEAVWARHVAVGVGIAAIGSPAYPAPFAADPEPPPVVFWRGDPTVVEGPRVGIVGTRRATRYGLEVAFELGAGLAAVGVAVVSGLALGIDGAAHAGACDVQRGPGVGPPIAVVGSGVDVVYPRAHAALWSAVADRGVVLSELPLGARPTKWRFPARNRLIAALADVLVVVESAPSGGSMHTVDAALQRDKRVMVVPGPIRSAASEGTNRLLGDGAAPVCGVDDVLVALGMTATVQATADRRPEPAAGDALVLDAMGWQPVSVDSLLLRTGLGLGELLTALERLAVDGWVGERSGWYERVATGSAP